MIELETVLTLDEICTSDNLVPRLSEKDLTAIGNMVHEEWMMDVTSRQDWETRMANAMLMALQVAEEKSFPWPKASNVKFPLITIGAIQYNARAYPALISGSDVVKCRNFSTEPGASERADRVARHMSYQVLERDSGWEESMDKVLFQQAIMGAAFKKVYYNAEKRRNEARMVLSRDLYIPYYAQSLNDAPRITHRIHLTRNEMFTRERRKIYMNWDEAQPPHTPSVVSSQEDAQQKAQGVTPAFNDPARPYRILEQHRYLDLDGDGYQEPYVVSVQEDTKKVLRVVARFSTTDVEYNSGKEVVYIHADQFFVKYPFIPSPDGGIYDLGFGVLLGSLSNSIDTLLNQIIDAGTLNNTAGGFLGRGIKFRSGNNTFAPFEWKRVDSSGDDIRKNIFPFPRNEPSNVLFQLVGFLVDYGERICLATDQQVGKNPGQNTPAETSRNVLAEGQRVLKAIYKRTYRALKEEFQLWYRLNSIHLQEEQFEAEARVFKVRREDYLKDVGEYIVPAADPNMVSSEQRLQRAILIKDSSLSTPGYNRYEVEKRFLQAVEAQEIDIIFPDPKGPNAVKPPPNPKVQVEMMRNEAERFKTIATLRVRIIELSQEQTVNVAKIMKLKAESAKLLAEADSLENRTKLEAIRTQLEAITARDQGQMESLKYLHELASQLETQGKDQGNGDNQGGMGGMEGQPGNQGPMGTPPAAPAGNPGIVG